MENVITYEVLIILVILIGIISLFNLINGKKNEPEKKCETKEKLFQKNFISFVIKKKYIDGTKNYTEYDFDFEITNLEPLEFIEKKNAESKNYYEGSKYVMATYSLLFFNTIIQHHD